MLKKYLEEDEADPNSKNDFGMNIIPALLRDGRKMYAYRFAGYWRDVGDVYKRQILNSDDAEFGGSGAVHNKAVRTHKKPMHGFCLLYTSV